MTPAARARRFVRFWWASIPEPRAVSTGFAIAYLVAIVGGISTLVDPPSHVTDDAEGLLILVGWFLIVGGVIAAAAGWRDAWAFERPGIALLVMAVASYMIVLAAAEHAGASRSTDFAMAGFGLLLLLIRLGMIWRYTRRPRG